MNHFIGIGRLTRNPDVRQTQTGKSVTSFTIAINRRGTDGADFIPVVTWNRLADICGQYLQKGSQVCVSGAIQLRTYQADDGSNRSVFEIVANEVEFLTRSGQSEENDIQTNKQSTKVDDGGESVLMENTEDDESWMLPF
ncbi:MAG: single-stranded DNA-binding protein [Clostridiales bacterium]|nr:single-stranded DNA-binding protein [Clostridiales bacterium]